jgi:Fanconi anemia group M protein
MIKIIIDHREDKKLIKELMKKNLNVEKKQLISADIILETKNINGKRDTVGIEIKKQNDFLNSMIDKRLISQLITLKENFSIPLLILEGSENIYEIRNFHPNSIRGMLSSVAIDYKIPILHTRNYRDTASLIEVIAKRIEKTKRPISLLKKKKPLTTKEQQEYIVESLPGVGPTLAKSLLKKFKTVKKIVNATQEKLEKVDKIGPKKAEKIKRVLEEIYEKS